jgi:hypothetical protein
LDKKFPEEICDMIVGYMLPSACTYYLQGRLSTAHASDTPPLNLFLVNRKMRKVAMRIWLKQNSFKLFAKTPYFNYFRDVVPLVPAEGNIETCIDWISRMAEFTMVINAVLVCCPFVGELFPQFFEIVKLFQKHRVFMTVTWGSLKHVIGSTSPGHNGLRIHLVRHPARQNIDPTIDARLYSLHLQMLDLGHEARAAGTSLVRLETQFNSLVEREGFSLISPPTVVFKDDLFGKRSSMMNAQISDFYHGANDLLYPTRQAAQAAILAVNKGDQPSTEALSPSWVRCLVVQLEDWSRELCQYRMVLEKGKKRSRKYRMYTMPRSWMPYPSVFGRYGSNVPFGLGHAISQYDRHIALLDEELHRTNAHITAMEPYCRSHISLPLAFL